MPRWITSALYSDGFPQDFFGFVMSAVAIRRLKFHFFIQKAPVMDHKPLWKQGTKLFFFVVV